MMLWENRGTLITEKEGEILRKYFSPYNQPNDTSNQGFGPIRFYKNDNNSIQSQQRVLMFRIFGAGRDKKQDG